jgi:hypothetical protein
MCKTANVDSIVPVRQVLEEIPDKNETIIERKVANSPEVLLQTS